MKKLLLITLLCPLTSFGQYKNDISLKLSSQPYERIQLEYRRHMSSAPFALTGSISYGSHTYHDGDLDVIVPDSFAVYNGFNSSSDFYMINLGIQRTLTFLPNPFFYVGASLGVGYDENLRYETRWDQVWTVDPSTSPHWEMENLEYTNLESHSQFLFEGQLSIGMDVPLLKRWTVNAQIDLSTYLGTFEGLSFEPSISGGIRYRFGAI